MAADNTQFLMPVKLAVGAASRMVINTASLHAKDIFQFNESGLDGRARWVPVQQLLEDDDALDKWYLFKAERATACLCTSLGAVAEVDPSASYSRTPLPRSTYVTEVQKLEQHDAAYWADMLRYTCNMATEYPHLIQTTPRGRRRLQRLGKSILQWEDRQWRERAARDGNPLYDEAAKRTDIKTCVTEDNCSDTVGLLSWWDKVASASASVRKARAGVETSTEAATKLNEELERALDAVGQLVEDHRGPPPQPNPLVPPNTQQLVLLKAEALLQQQGDLSRSGREAEEDAAEQAANEERSAGGNLVLPDQNRRSACPRTPVTTAVARSRTAATIISAVNSAVRRGTAVHATDEDQRAAATALSRAATALSPSDLRAAASPPVTPRLAAGTSLESTFNRESWMPGQAVDARAYGNIPSFVRDVLYTQPNARVLYADQKFMNSSDRLDEAIVHAAGSSGPVGQDSGVKMLSEKLAISTSGGGLHFEGAYLSGLMGIYYPAGLYAVGAVTGRKTLDCSKVMDSYQAWRDFTINVARASAGIEITLWAANDDYFPGVEALVDRKRNLRLEAFALSLAAFRKTGPRGRVPPPAPQDPPSLLEGPATPAAVGPPRLPERPAVGSSSPATMVVATVGEPESEMDVAADGDLAPQPAPKVDVTNMYEVDELVLRKRLGRSFMYRVRYVGWPSKFDIYQTKREMLCCGLTNQVATKLVKDLATREAKAAGGDVEAVRLMKVADGLPGLPGYDAVSAADPPASLPQHATKTSKTAKRKTDHVRPPTKRSKGKSRSKTAVVVEEEEEPRGLPPGGVLPEGAATILEDVGNDPSEEDGDSWPAATWSLGGSKDRWICGCLRKYVRTGCARDHVEAKHPHAEDRAQLLSYWPTLRRDHRRCHQITIPQCRR
jgi:hypothetical protein